MLPPVLVHLGRHVATQGALVVVVLAFRRLRARCRGTGAAAGGAGSRQRDVVGTCGPGAEFQRRVAGASTRPAALDVDQSADSYRVWTDPGKQFTPVTPE